HLLPEPRHQVEPGRHHLQKVLEPELAIRPRRGVQDGQAAHVIVVRGRLQVQERSVLRSQSLHRRPSRSPSPRRRGYTRPASTGRVHTGRVGVLIASLALGTLVGLLRLTSPAVRNLVYRKGASWYLAPNLQLEPTGVPRYMKPPRDQRMP